jgi:hypothetical protein
MRNIISLFLFFCSYFLNAQQIPFQLQKSKIFEDDYKDSKIILAEKVSDNDFVVVRSFKRQISSKRGYYIEKYNDSLIKTTDFEFEISHSLHEKYSFVLGVFSNKSNIYIVEMFQDLKSKEFICQANIIDDNYNFTQKELFRLNKEELKGFSLKDLFFYYDNLNSFNENSGTFRLNLSADLFLVNKEKILNLDNEIIMKVNKSKDLFSLALTFNDKKINTLKLYLFDKDFNKKFEKNIINNSNQIVHHNIELDESSEIIYLTDKKYLDELKNKENGGKYRYEIKKITSQDIETCYIDVKNYYIPLLKTYINNHKLYCLGFISNASDFSYNGISFFDLDTKIFQLNNYTFNLFSDQFLIDKYGKVKNKEIKDISLKNVFFNDTNEIIINAEEEYLSESGIGISRTFYNYDDLISIKLSSTGNLLYARNINKTQSTSNKDDVFFISYFSFFKNNKNYFLINTDNKLEKLSNDRIEFKDVGKNKSNLVFISIDENGNFDFSKVLDNESNEVPFMVSKGIFLNNSIVFLGRKGRKKQLLKLKL